jgi:hypothetical protein
MDGPRAAVIDSGPAQRTPRRRRDVTRGAAAQLQKWPEASSCAGTQLSEITFAGGRSERTYLVDNVSDKLYGRLKYELDPLTLSAQSAFPEQAQITPGMYKVSAIPGSFPPKIRDIRPTSKDSMHGQIGWRAMP